MADARIKALETQNTELNKIVADLKTELSVAEKRLDSLESANKGQQGAKGKKDKKNKEKKTEAAPQLSKADKKKADADKAAEKVKAACVKEGGKKGQDLCGMHDMGGMIYFVTVMEKPMGDWDLLQACMDGANKEIDPTGDDRKGGSAHLGKCFIASDEVSSANFLFYLPKSVAEDKGLSLKEWAETMMNNSAVEGEIVELNDETCKAIAKQNADKELFPLKQRDAAINASFDLLRSKLLIPEDDSGSEDDVSAMYEEAGVEW